MHKMKVLNPEIRINPEISRPCNLGNKFFPLRGVSFSDEDW